MFWDLLYWLIYHPHAFKCASRAANLGKPHKPHQETDISSLKIINYWSYNPDFKAAEHWLNWPRMTLGASTIQSRVRSQIIMQQIKTNQNTRNSVKHNSYLKSPQTKRYWLIVYWHLVLDIQQSGWLESQRCKMAFSSGSDTNICLIFFPRLTNAKKNK